MSSMQDMMRKLLGIGGMPCSDVQKLLFDYVQGNLDEESTRLLKEHLGDCPDCLDFVESYRKTIGACRMHCQKKVEIPAALEQKLKDFIAKNCK